MKNSSEKLMSLTKGNDVFSAPWHCELFALTILLYEKKVFDWALWTAALGNKLKDKPVSMGDDLDYYYGSWLEALEELILSKEMTYRDDFKREVLSQMKHLRDDHH
ncbi:nitrile hydratase accessory protein [Paracoccaceae bacterium]|nr:nitrile hydratase accessory protein [Paracoccaceae bacterium]